MRNATAVNPCWTKPLDEKLSPSMSCCPLIKTVVFMHVPFRHLVAFDSVLLAQLYLTISSHCLNGQSGGGLVWSLGKMSREIGWSWWENFLMMQTRRRQTVLSDLIKIAHQYFHKKIALNDRLIFHCYNCYCSWSINFWFTFWGQMALSVNLV